MKRVLILQKYLMPYRVPLFNVIADHPNVELFLIYYGKKAECRKATIYPEKRFQERQCKILYFKASYEANIEIPIGLYKLFRELKPDVIICAPDYAGIISFVYTSVSSSKIIIWSEATEVTERNRIYLKKFIRKIIYNYAWRFIVPGLLSDIYIRKYRPNAHVFKANNSIEEDKFKFNASLIKDKFKNITQLQITYSGSLVNRKGIIPLLEGFTGLLKDYPKFKKICFLRVLGTGPVDLSNFHGGNISFEGFCEGDLYVTYMKSSHIFILPSLQDQNPLTVIEALFTGNVILVTEGVGNYPEVLEENGILICSGTAEEIKLALREILIQPINKLKNMALTSLKLSRNFTTAKSGEGFLSAILE